MYRKTKIALNIPQGKSVPIFSSKNQVRAGFGVVHCSQLQQVSIAMQMDAHHVRPTASVLHLWHM